MTRKDQGIYQGNKAWKIRRIADGIKAEIIVRSHVRSLFYIFQAETAE
ncbi:hypothetical protein IFJ82_06810 [Novacetimonas hansenii]|uniref:Transposase n=1 Tax=Novacetimonas hansenii TaxID=436 RepID=A0AAW5ERU2_NOVHA|nr:hypothetical protein [Novacetimonas hansenii]MBL7235005.1 hypothetical protein [Novacetimonas hansenii]MCJ8354541.1 hypothetical protein [Novacetimonas hansenii]QOF96269.1 hypothetical protein IFJ82_06810 [Novacetimonas hansenii]WEQ59188.1 hypothetical protein LV563_01060 [Novacetimonas hansenii]